MSASTNTHRALVITSQDAGPQVINRPTPKPAAGTVLLRILAAPVLSYSREIYPPTNSRGYVYALPLVPGSSAIARIEAGDPDSSSGNDSSTSPLKVGQLVLFSCYVRARADTRAGTQARYLLGVSQGFTPSSAALMSNSNRDGAFAELITSPVENVFVLDEKRLLGSPSQGGLGLDLPRLCNMLTPTVPFGGLRSVDLKAGETVIIAPATGNFGSAAVMLALAIGAKVIALGRSDENLHALRKAVEKTGRAGQLQTVKLQNDVESMVKVLTQAAGLGGVDVFFDISPPHAAEKEGEAPSYVRAGIRSLRHGGRCCLMGGLKGDVGLPYERIMHFDITIKGKWMYEPEDVRDLIKMAEAGVFSFEWVSVVGNYALGEWEKAWQTAAEQAGMGQTTIIEPQR